MKKKQKRKTAMELVVDKKCPPKMGCKGRAEQQSAGAFLKGKEVHEGNEVIKRYVRGDAHGRCSWIYYFYTECTNIQEIRKNCKKLFGGHRDTDAEGYVGAYTLLQELSKYSVEYWAGFNYSYEQMEANYD